MIDWGTIGAGAVALAGLAVAAWQKLQSMKVDKANNDAKIEIASSQEKVYEQLKERLTDLTEQVKRLNSEMDELRQQVRERDMKIHTLELYIKDLEYTLHKHGIDVPK